MGQIAAPQDGKFGDEVWPYVPSAVLQENWAGKTANKIPRDGSCNCPNK
jgi:hypothetical protein